MWEMGESIMNLYYLWPSLLVIISWAIYLLMVGHERKQARLATSNFIDLNIRQHLPEFKLNIYFFIVLVFSLCCIPIAIFINESAEWPVSPDPMDWGVIGDFFGGMLNPILAFASFVALLFTIRIQTKSISDFNKSQAQARFESSFYVLFEQLTKSYRPTADRKRMMNPFKAQPNFDVKRMSKELSNFVQANEPQYQNFLALFFVTIDLVDKSNPEGKGFYYNLIAHLLDGFDCYFVAGLIYSERINTIGHERALEIINNHSILKFIEYGTTKDFINCPTGIGPSTWCSLSARQLGLRS